MRGVSGEGLGMDVLKGFEVMDGMPHTTIFPVRIFKIYK